MFTGIPTLGMSVTCVLVFAVAAIDWKNGTAGNVSVVGEQILFQHVVCQCVSTNDSNETRPV